MRTAARAIVKAHQGHCSRLLVAGSNRPLPIFSVVVVKRLPPIRGACRQRGRQAPVLSGELVQCLVGRNVIHKPLLVKSIERAVGFHGGKRGVDRVNQITALFEDKSQVLAG